MKLSRGMVANQISRFRFDHVELEAELHQGDLVVVRGMGSDRKRQSAPIYNQAGVRIPFHRKKDRFCAGFNHRLKGGQLDDFEYMRLSFREGFRAAKLYLRQVRRSQGILVFPTRWRVRMKATCNIRPSYLARPSSAHRIASICVSDTSNAFRLVNLC